MQPVDRSPVTLEIRNPVPEEYGALRSLWQSVFGDGPDYIDRFFQSADPSACALTAWDGERLASMLYLLPSVFTLDGVSCDGCYVYAVATDPDYRGRGIMTRLEGAACRLAAQDGAKCMALVPANAGLFPMYHKLGYRTRFYLGTSEVAPAVKPAAKLSRCSRNDFLTLRRELLRGKACSFDLYPSGCEYRYHEFQSSGGEILLAEASGAVGYLAGRREGEVYRIAETSLTGRPLAEAAGVLRSRDGVRRVLVTGSCGTLHPYGMLKLLDGAPDGARIRTAAPYMNLMLN